MESFWWCTYELKDSSADGLIADWDIKKDARSNGLVKKIFNVHGGEDWCDAGTRKGIWRWQATGGKGLNEKKQK